MFYHWRPYVPAGKRREAAKRELKKLKARGHPVAPIVLEGRKIARTFWGKAWCDNLEGYSDYSNRLPRGRTYVRNGSVIDLQVASGAVSALVSGSEIYRVTIGVTPVSKASWASICRDCAGAIDSLVDLLQGRLSRSVMERVCRRQVGLFPAPPEIKFSCTCPDWAAMCKHVAAVLYGIGARLDDEPELLFRLRDVDEAKLIAKAGSGLQLTSGGPTADRVLGDQDLSALFGVEIDAGGGWSEQDGNRAQKGGKGLALLKPSDRGVASIPIDPTPRSSRTPTVKGGKKRKMRGRSKRKAKGKKDGVRRKRS